MKAHYSAGFIEQALTKVYSRGNRTIKSVAEELNINPHTVKNWMKQKSAKLGLQSSGLTSHAKRPNDWSAAAKLVALHETHGLAGEALHAWCREHGVFAHHLTSWQAAFCAPPQSTPDALQNRSLVSQNDQLKRELARKDKALAEAAALLVLQKKFRALWEDEVK